MAMVDDEEGVLEDRPMFRMGLGTWGASRELEQRVAQARARLHDEDGDEAGA